MDSAEFREKGKNLVDYIADYAENLNEKRVIPNTKPDYLRALIPDSPPQTPDTYEEVIRDVSSYIMPGVTHWQHPQFHAYFPAGNSFPAIMGEMLASAISTNSFSWASCPASTELETIVLDWFGKMIGLPTKFMHHAEGSKGGGVIQPSASDCVFVALLAARHGAIQKMRLEDDSITDDATALKKLVAYCSQEAHSSVEKASKLGVVKLRELDTDEDFSMRGSTLREAIEKDINDGLVPFFVTATLGTTSSCAFDKLAEIGPVCNEYNIWLHVDAAYAGNAMICPEFKYLLEGINFASSFSTNPYKLLNTTLDCSTMWVDDHSKLTRAFAVDPLYLTHNYGDKFKGGKTDYRHWGISLSRRFRALKLWFVIRMYGVRGLQQFIRRHVLLAKKFEELLRADSLFEVINDVVLGLVVFRVRGTNSINQLFLNRLNESGLIFMVPALLGNRFAIRFCVCAENANFETILASYKIIHEAAVATICKLFSFLPIFLCRFFLK
ncbi:unnamed protein product [Enterobius vermicularis]|uniref:Aromatic-L-amino-acid decarboxylase n=1 Tax=Enterobius vermicularis TaxID=51028 RepID=A0A0N4UYE5_ENTVE|nr:unnamed protein product [Enterobius vermicularis]